jgi:hypothetical protein
MWVGHVRSSLRFRTTRPSAAALASCCRHADKLARHADGPLTDGRSPTTHQPLGAATAFPEADEEGRCLPARESAELVGVTPGGSDGTSMVTQQGFDARSSVCLLTGGASLASRTTWTSATSTASPDRSLTWPCWRFLCVIFSRLREPTWLSPPGDESRFSRRRVGSQGDAGRDGGLGVMGLRLQSWLWVNRGPAAK